MNQDGFSKLFLTLLIVIGAIFMVGVFFFVRDERRVSTTLENTSGTSDLDPYNSSDFDHLGTPKPGSDKLRENIDADQTKGQFTSEIQGRVVDETGQGLRGVKLKLEQGVLNLLTTIQGAANSTFSLETVSGPRGRFLFQNVPPYENYIITAKHNNYADARLSYVQVLSRQPIEIADIVMKPGLMLTGLIKDQGGNPIANAEVTIEPIQLRPFGSQFKSGAEDAVNQTVKSNASGYFEIRNLAPGQASLNVLASGYARQIVPNIFLQEENPKPNYEIILEEGKTLAGRVVDTNGKPIGNAAVEATSYSSEKHSKGQANSDNSGRFVVQQLGSGTYFLVASADGYSTKRENRVNAGDASIEIIMTPQTSVSGRVIGADTGVPITKFSMELRRPTPNSEQPAFVRLAQNTREFQSPQGSFTFDKLDVGNTYVLLVTAEGYAPTFSQEFSVTRENPLTGIEIAMQKGASIQGIVVDGKTKQPIQAALIKTLDNHHVDNPLSEMLSTLMPEDSLHKSTTSNVDGAFYLENIASGTYQVEISANGYTPEKRMDISVGLGSKVNLGEISLLTGATISGYAYDGSGQPLSGGQINLRSKSQGRDITLKNTRTDATGYFILRNIPTGDYEISVARSAADSANFLRVIMESRKSKQDIHVEQSDILEVNLTLPD